MTEKEWLDIFGDNLVRLMGEARVTQEQLAKATGLSQGTISKYINKQQMPGVKAIINLSDALFCTIDELIDFRERRSMIV